MADTSKGSLAEGIRAKLRLQGEPSRVAAMPIKASPEPTPFYCLEAWTYQNFARARAICEELGTPAGSELLDEWEADPSQLDEVIGPPDIFPLNKHYNVELTERGYPADRVYKVDKSFAASVNEALSCKPLLDALSRLSRSASPSPA